MKVRILRLRNAPQVETERISSYLLRNKSLTTTFEQVSILDLPNPVQGINTTYPEAYGADVTSYIPQYGKDCDWLIVLWDANQYEDWIAFTGWTGDIILTSMPIDTADDFYRLASHEIEHGLWGMLAFQYHIPSQDHMDDRLMDYSWSHELEPDSPLGNRARSHAAMKPYLGMLRFPDRFDKSSIILGLLKTLSGLWQKVVAKQEVIPPNGMIAITRVFGNYQSPTFESNNIISFKLPYPLYYNGVAVTTTRAHRLIVPNLVNALSEIESSGYAPQVRNFSGIYNQRPQVGSTKPSTHAWGIAIDIEAEEYPRGTKKVWPKEITDIFLKHGFSNGALFPTPDPMHFQCCTGY